MGRSSFSGVRRELERVFGIVGQLHVAQRMGWHGAGQFTGTRVAVRQGLGDETIVREVCAHVLRRLG